jgi:hypothetical protein
MLEAQQPVPPVSPTPSAGPVGPGSPTQGAPPGTGPYVYTPQQISGPQAILAAARAAREELGNQLESLEERRQELSQQLRRSEEGIDRDGVQRRISAIDQRIVELDKQIQAADDAVAKAAAIPGAATEVPEPPAPPDPDAMTEQIAIVSSVFTLFVLFPLTIAYARRLWRRGAVAVAELPKVLAERLTRLDQAVDTIAIEVERISEGQRFLTKVMTDHSSGRAIGAGPAQPLEIDSREGVPVPRSSSR